MKIYLGYDRREHLAYKVAEHSLKTTSTAAIDVTPLNIQSLELSGLMYRAKRIVNGKVYDDISNAPMSTEFAISRFLTPILAQSGWALFMDSDIVAMSDIANVMNFADPKYAVMCVKHPPLPIEGLKMDGQVQTYYDRKNWSSVMLFNCDHYANRMLDIKAINTMRGLDLHRFAWLKDDQIGELPDRYNWLVNVRSKPNSPVIAHFTQGGPWFESWKRVPNDDIWMEALLKYDKELINAQV